MSSAFIGAIPQYYDRHLGPVLFESYAIDLARRVPRDVRRVLEIAAGTGRVTRHVLAALGADAALVVTDLNAAMLDEAKRRVTDPRASWQVADAQSLTFDAATFDAVVCQFGIMFVPDTRLAFRELRRVLRPGGTLVFSTWDQLQHNGATAIAHDLIVEAFPADPPMFYLTPFSMPDAVAVRELVRSEGFASVTSETVAAVAESESAEHLAIGLVRGNPIIGQLAERGLDPVAYERLIAEALAARYGAVPCRSPMSAHVFTAIA